MIKLLSFKIIFFLGLVSIITYYACPLLSYNLFTNLSIISIIFYILYIQHNSTKRVTHLLYI